MGISIERRTYSAPLSYVGSARRISHWGKRFHGWTAVGTWTLALVALLGMWAFVTAWYVVAFGVFGLFTIPFRFFRRSQRRTNHLLEAQLETLQR